MLVDVNDITNVSIRDQKVLIRQAYGSYVSLLENKKLQLNKPEGKLTRDFFTGLDHTKSKTTLE